MRVSRPLLPALLAGLGVLASASPAAAATFEERLTALETTVSLQARDIADLKARVATLEAQNAALHGRLVTLESIWGGVASRSGTEITLTGVNLNIRNGLGATDTVNGTGNLVVGYNEPRLLAPTIVGRGGSHNIVAGMRNQYSSSGGIVAGVDNVISAKWATVTAGFQNAANGELTSVTGGRLNVASGLYSAVSGGSSNRSSGPLASVSGGSGNEASGFYSSVSGGENNDADGDRSWTGGGQGNGAVAPGSSIVGGLNNDTLGFASTVCGGQLNEASGQASLVAGGSDNAATGLTSVVSGGTRNVAAGRSSVVGGGASRSVTLENNWRAGALLQAN